MALQDMFDALVARGPSALLARHAGTFARLIGSWRVEVLDADADGVKRVNQGEWHFGWVLEGRAIQDVLIVPQRQDRSADTLQKGNRYVTSLRVFDAAAETWRVFSADPVRNAYCAMTARDTDGRIVEQGADIGGNSYRIVLSKFSPDSFEAREERLDDAKNWETTAEFHARRMA